MRESFVIFSKGDSKTFYKDELNDNTIKEIYFFATCDSRKSPFLEEYIYNHCTKRQLIDWNNEYVNLELDKAFKALDEATIDDIDRIKQICFMTFSFNIYIEDKETYKRIIKFYHELHKKFGYFMHYDIKYLGFVGDVDNYLYSAPQTTLIDLMSLVLKGRKKINGVDYLVELTKYCNSSRYLFYYHPEFAFTNHKFKYQGSPIAFRGIIPSLYYLGYYDVLDEIYSTILIPILENFWPDCEVVKKHSIEYYMVLKDENGYRECFDREEVKGHETIYIMKYLYYFFKCREIEIPEKLDMYFIKDDKVLCED